MSIDNLTYSAIFGDTHQLAVALIQATVTRGAAVVGIFHDAEVRNAVCHQLFELNREMS